MASSRQPPQLDLSLPPPLKRSFQQFGLDVDDDGLSSGEVGSAADAASTASVSSSSGSSSSGIGSGSSADGSYSGSATNSSHSSPTTNERDGNERNKRARSEGPVNARLDNTEGGSRPLFSGRLGPIGASSSRAVSSGLSATRPGNATDYSPWLHTSTAGTRRNHSASFSPTSNYSPSTPPLPDFVAVRATTGAQDGVSLDLSNASGPEPSAAWPSQRPRLDDGPEMSSSATPTSSLELSQSAFLGSNSVNSSAGRNTTRSFDTTNNPDTYTATATRTLANLLHTREQRISGPSLTSRTSTESIAIDEGSPVFSDRSPLVFSHTTDLRGAATQQTDLETHVHLSLARARSFDRSVAPLRVENDRPPGLFASSAILQQDERTGSPSVSSVGPPPDTHSAFSTTSNTLGRRETLSLQLGTPHMIVGRQFASDQGLSVEPDSADSDVAHDTPLAAELRMVSSQGERDRARERGRDTAPEAVIDTFVRLESPPVRRPTVPAFEYNRSHTATGQSQNNYSARRREDIGPRPFRTSSQTSILNDGSNNSINRNLRQAAYDQTTSFYHRHESPTRQPNWSHDARFQGSHLSAPRRISVLTSNATNVASGHSYFHSRPQANSPFRNAGNHSLHLAEGLDWEFEQLQSLHDGMQERTINAERNLMPEESQNVHDTSHPWQPLLPDLQLPRLDANATLDERNRNFVAFGRRLDAIYASMERMDGTDARLGEDSAFAIGTGPRASLSFLRDVNRTLDRSRPHSFNTNVGDVFTDSSRNSSNTLRPLLLPDYVSTSVANSASNASTPELHRSHTSNRPQNLVPTRRTEQLDVFPWESPRALSSSVAQRLSQSRLADGDGIGGRGNGMPPSLSLRPPSVGMQVRGEVSTNSSTIEDPSALPITSLRRPRLPTLRSALFGSPESDASIENDNLRQNGKGLYSYQICCPIDQAGMLDFAAELDDRLHARPSQLSFNDMARIPDIHMSQQDERPERPSQLRSLPGLSRTSTFPDIRDVDRQRSGGLDVSPTMESGGFRDISEEYMGSLQGLGEAPQDRLNNRASMERPQDRLRALTLAANRLTGLRSEIDSFRNSTGDYSNSHQEQGQEAPSNRSFMERIRNYDSLVAQYHVGPERDPLPGGLRPRSTGRLRPVPVSTPVNNSEHQMSTEIPVQASSSSEEAAYYASGPSHGLARHQPSASVLRRRRLRLLSSLDESRLDHLALPEMVSSTRTLDADDLSASLSSGVDVLRPSSPEDAIMDTRLTSSPSNDLLRLLYPGRFSTAASSTQQSEHTIPTPFSSDESYNPHRLGISIPGRGSTIRWARAGDQRRPPENMPTIGHPPLSPVHFESDSPIVPRDEEDWGGIFVAEERHRIDRLRQFDRLASANERRSIDDPTPSLYRSGNPQNASSHRASNEMAAVRSILSRSRQVRNSQFTESASTASVNHAQYFEHALNVLRGDGLSTTRQQQFQNAFEREQERDRQREPHAIWGEISGDDERRPSAWPEQLHRRINSSLFAPPPENADNAPPNRGANNNAHSLRYSSPPLPSSFTFAGLFSRLSPGRPRARLRSRFVRQADDAQPGGMSSAFRFGRRQAMRNMGDFVVSGYMIYLGVAY